MTTARREIVWDAERGVYHCMVRCVRGGSLQRADDHRKEWIRCRLAKIIKVVRDGYGGLCGDEQSSARGGAYATGPGGDMVG
jgi:hypothetical protein